MLLKYLVILLLLLVNDRPSLGMAGSGSMDILTGRRWIMSDYGFDENHNGHLDPNESRIEDCERDDTYEFYKDGSGCVKSNYFSCCNGLDEQYFRWRLTGNMYLQLFAESMKITRLTAEDLVTAKSVTVKGTAIDLITIYRSDINHKPSSK